jgi:hypothetical protein
VRYLRSTILPGEEKCFCLFKRLSAAVVRTANDRAELPDERIVEAMHVAAGDLAERGGNESVGLVVVGRDGPPAEVAYGVAAVLT